MALTVDDRLEIYELYSRYAHYYDFAKAESLADLFVANGRFAMPGIPPLEGREALIDLVNNGNSMAPGCSHQTANIYLDETPTGARGHAYALVLRAAPGDVLRCCNLGYYEDDLVLTDGGWRFAARDFRSWLDPATFDRPFEFSGQAVMGAVEA